MPSPQEVYLDHYVEACSLLLQGHHFAAIQIAEPAGEPITKRPHRRTISVQVSGQVKPLTITFDLDVSTWVVAVSGQFPQEGAYLDLGKLIGMSLRKPQ